jgi:hypothetical protein
MFKMRCRVCGSTHTKKNGVRTGVQLYKCMNCGYQFRACSEVSNDELWTVYQQEKQTIKELSVRFRISVATVKRRLHDVKCEWVQPSLSGSGFVHLDVTYWGRNFGVLLALDTENGKPLYLSFVKSETVKDYEEAVISIEKRGYTIRGLIIDGKKSLFKSFSGYHVQMCQFHMKQIVRRYLTLNPRMLAGRDLKTLVDKLHLIHEADFRTEYQAWKEKWKDTLAHRSLHKDGKMHYTHRRLRAVMNSIDFYLPYLFTYQREDCIGMPNTNNKIEGTFTDLKKNLNNHSGLTQENRKRFINGFFSALIETLSIKK